MSIKNEQIIQIHKFAPLSIMGQIVVTLMIVYILFRQVPDFALSVWGGLSLLVLMVRAFSVYNCRPAFYSEKSKKKIKRWFKFYRISVFFSGTLLGSTVYFIDYYQPADLHFFFLATAFALSGAAIVTIGEIFSIYLAYIVPLLLINIISLFMSTGPVYFEAGILSVIGTGFLILTAHKESRNMFDLFSQKDEVAQTQKEIINRLSAAGEYKDNDTGLHIKRMSHSCYLLAIRAGFSTYQAEQILEASPMHDVGKIGISDKILLKPGKLNEEEWK